MMNQDDATRATLDDFMADAGFSNETRLYRSTLPEFLDQSGEEGVRLISANEDPTEAVVNIYEGGFVSLASQIGRGLAWVRSPDNEWSQEGRVTVELRLGDALDSGGLLYPVESVITEPTFFVTMPSGRLPVQVVP